MKKVICGLAIGVLLGSFLVGCSNEVANAETSGGKAKFQLEDTDLAQVTILIDKETGLEYIVISSQSGVGISPRYSNQCDKYTNTIKIR